MLGNDSRAKSFLDAVLFVRPMTNPGRRETIWGYPRCQIHWRRTELKRTRFLVACA